MSQNTVSSSAADSFVDRLILCCCRYYDAQTVDRWDESEDWRPWIVLTGIVSFFWSLIILTTIVFEVSPWSAYFAYVSYTIGSILSLLAGVTKKTPIIRVCLVFQVLSVTLILIAVVLNALSFSDRLTHYCADNVIPSGKCDELRLISFVVLSSIAVTNVICCGAYAFCAYMYDYSTKMDNWLRSL